MFPWNLCDIIYCINNKQLKSFAYTIDELTHWGQMAHICISDYNMTVWILMQNDINFSMAAGLNKLHMPGVK